MILGQYDVDCSPSHLGFRKEHSCAELVTVVRLLIAKRREWGLRTCLAQIDFARAYDSIRHAVPQRCWLQCSGEEFPCRLPSRTSAKPDVPAWYSVTRIGREIQSELA